MRWREYLRFALPCASTACWSTTASADGWLVTTLPGDEPAMAVAWYPVPAVRPIGTQIPAPGLSSTVSYPCSLHTALLPRGPRPREPPILQAGISLSRLARCIAHTPAIASISLPPLCTLLALCAATVRLCAMLSAPPTTSFEYLEPHLPRPSSCPHQVPATRGHPITVPANQRSQQIGVAANQ